MKYFLTIILAAAFMICSSADLYATGQSQHNPLAGLSQHAIKIIKNAIPSSIIKAMDDKSYVETATIQTQTDSTVMWKEGHRVSKTAYQWSEKGELQKKTEYEWYSSSQKLEPTTYYLYGPGGEDKPEYTIKGGFDDNGNEQPMYMTIKDYTYYKSLPNNIINNEDLQGFKAYEWVNGQWELKEHQSTVIRDSLVRSVAYYLNNELSDSTILDYNSKGQVTKKTYIYDDKKFVMDAKYDEKDRITYFGYDDKSWYEEYLYSNDTTIFTTNKMNDNGIVMPIEKILSYVTHDTKMPDFPENEAVYVIEDNEYDDGVWDYGWAYYTSATGDVMVGCTLDSNGNKSDYEGFSISRNGDSYEITYFTYDDKMTRTVLSRYRIVVDNSSEYVKSETFYDDINNIAYTLFTYLHNPNPTSVQNIREALPHNSRIYDIMGRMTNSTKGLYIQNGRVMYGR